MRTPAYIVGPVLFESLLRRGTYGGDSVPAAFRCLEQAPGFDFWGRIAMATECEHARVPYFGRMLIINPGGRN